MNMDHFILPNSPPTKQQEFENEMENMEEWLDREERDFEQGESDAVSNFDPRIMGDFHLGSNSSTLAISPGQWV